MKKWREDILIEVSKGENYDIYSHTLLPSAKNESEILAMRLVHFEKVQGSHLHPASIEKTKEEESAEVTKRIIYSTNMLEPIFVTYLSESESHDTNTESDTTKRIIKNIWDSCKGSNRQVEDPPEQ